MHKKHSLLMILCCLVPIVLVMFFAHRFEGTNWFWLFLLLCPVMHVFMMKSMHKGECDQEDTPLDENAKK